MAETNKLACLSVSVELFEGLPETDCQRALSSANRRQYPAGQEIFRAGESKETIFLLLWGLVKVSQVDANGNEVIVWLDGPGQIIGSLNWVAGCSHSTTAKAVQTSTVVSCNLAAFETMLDRYPTLAKNAQRIVSRQMKELSNRICEISTAPAWLCMGRTLIRLAEQFGQRVNGHFEIEVTQEALAQLAGTTVFNVNHRLSDWESLGIVLRRRCTIIVRDLAELKRMCRAYRPVGARMAKG
jgi:CRP-like cAMP-binding protein